jgi:hypothetical protein
MTGEVAPGQLRECLVALKCPRLLYMCSTWLATLFPGVPAMYIGTVNHPDVARYNHRSVAWSRGKT